jgi:hypothetical protein
MPFMEPTLDDALLTAYLDGELTPLDRQRLEERLANESELRHRLALLEETWHYLDLLEPENADAEQIETTLKLAAVSVSGVPFLPPKMSRFGTWGIAALAGIVLFTVTFNFGKRDDLDDPSFRRMVERLDMYLYLTSSEGDGLDLLRRLAKRRVFLPPLPEDVPPVDPLEYEPSPRSGWRWDAWVSPLIYSRSESGEAELYHVFYNNFQRFRTLIKEKQEQVRKLHHAIESAPRNVELVRTLQNYYHWIKSLQSYEKLALRQRKPLEEKVADILALKERLAKQQEDGTLPMPSAIVGIEEGKRLAETFAKLPLQEQERLLNNTPIYIIDKLQQSSSY